MKNKYILIILLFTTVFSFAQESNQGKKLWAKSILNEKAPALTVSEWIGDIPDTRGKFILVDFWATWCGPCRRAIPELNAIQKQFAEKLVVIGLSDERIEKVKAMRKPVIEYYHGVDTSATMKKALEVRGVPHVILIDPEGIVRWEGFPFLKDHKLTPQVLRKLIRKYD